MEGIHVLEASVHDYIRYYNHERIKLELKGLSPVGQVIPGPIQNEQSVRAQLDSKLHSNESH
ncbi:MAG TPA: hypothetical protein DCS80_03080 [Betaproteobacteria bacterium]|nr:hypothetical protein [Betaproteobacteria bacterium]